MNIMHWLSSPFVLLLSETLIHFLWQGMVVLFVWSLWLTAFGNRGAKHRHNVSLAAMAVLGICPLATFFILPSTTSPVSPAPPAPISLSEAVPEDDANLRSAPQEFPDFSADELAAMAGFAATTELNASIGQPEPVQPVEENLAESEASASPRWWHQYRPWIAIIWLIGVAVFSARLLAGVAGILWLRFNTKTVPLWLTDLCGDLTKRMKLTAQVPICASAKVIEATVLGFFKPVVLVPVAWLSEMPPEVWEAVLAHELAHVRRFDLWVNLFQRLMETFLFYHPAVWWISSRLRLEREMCCDEWAVAATGRRSAYAETLELVARRRQSSAWPSLATGIGGSQMALLRRVRNVLGQGNSQNAVWPAGLLSLVILLGIGMSVTDLPRVTAEEDAVTAEGNNESEEIERDETERVAGVPLLANIPVLGALFGGGEVSEAAPMADVSPSDEEADTDSLIRELATAVKELKAEMNELREEVRSRRTPSRESAFDNLRAYELQSEASSDGDEKQSLEELQAEISLLEDKTKSNEELRNRIRAEIGSYQGEEANAKERVLLSQLLTLESNLNRAKEQQREVEIDLRKLHIAQQIAADPRQQEIALNSVLMEDPQIRDLAVQARTLQQYLAEQQRIAHRDTPAIQGIKNDLRRAEQQLEDAKQALVPVLREQYQFQNSQQLETESRLVTVEAAALKKQIEELEQQITAKKRELADDRRGKSELDAVNGDLEASRQRQDETVKQIRVLDQKLAETRAENAATTARATRRSRSDLQEKMFQLPAGQVRKVGQLIVDLHPSASTMARGDGTLTVSAPPDVMKQVERLVQFLNETVAPASGSDSGSAEDDAQRTQNDEQQTSSRWPALFGNRAAERQLAQSKVELARQRARTEAERLELQKKLENSQAAQEELAKQLEALKQRLSQPPGERRTDVDDELQERYRELSIGQQLENKWKEAAEKSAQQRDAAMKKLQEAEKALEKARQEAAKKAQEKAKEADTKAKQAYEQALKSWPKELSEKAAERALDFLRKQQPDGDEASENSQRLEMIEESIRKAYEEAARKAARAKDSIEEKIEKTDVQQELEERLKALEKRLRELVPGATEDEGAEGEKTSGSSESKTLSAANREHRIAPGDVLGISYNNTEDPSKSEGNPFAVGPDGTIQIVSQGRKSRVAGLTFAEAKSAIQQDIGVSNVTVTMLRPRNAYFYVIVENTGDDDDRMLRFPYRGAETVLDVLFKIEELPPLERADVSIFQPSIDGNSAPRSFPVSWKAIASGQDTSTNYQILPGDRIFVREKAPAPNETAL